MMSLGRGDHLRHAAHRQLRARRAIHAGRLRGLVPAAAARPVPGLGCRGSTTGGRWPSCRWPSGWSARDGAAVHPPGLRSRPRLRPAADHRARPWCSRGCSTWAYGAAGQQYDVPARCKGGINLGFMFLPVYRLWVIVAALVVCFGTWFLIERTRLGSYLRAATENPDIVRGLRHQRAAAADADLRLRRRRSRGSPGVMAAPIYQVSPQMGQNIVIVVFAVVVIGGMGSISGAIVSGLRARPDRGPDQGVLSAGLQHGDLRDHGGRPDLSGRPACSGGRQPPCTRAPTLVTGAPAASSRTAGSWLIVPGRGGRRRCRSSSTRSSP